MEKSRNQTFSTWSGIHVRPDSSFFPENEHDVSEIFSLEKPFSIRGLGKNYTDAGLHSKNMVSNQRLNRILLFNQRTGRVRLQSGVVLHDLLMEAIPKGWIVPTIPGTAHVTIGGMIASNVHGKNQYKAGSIGDYVRSFILQTPAWGKLECSPTQNRDLFDATVGGMGTTGLIEEIELQLQMIDSPYLNTNYIKTKNFFEQIQIMESKRSSSDFTIGWLDHHSLKGENIHGLIEHANYCEDENFSKSKISFRSIPVPFHMPISLVNSSSIKLFNQFTYAKNYPSDTPIHFYEFNFKLDKIGHWNRLYGRKGLIQYQCLIPKTQEIGKNLLWVLQYLQKNNLPSTLVVLKLHRTDPFGHLSFSKEGMSMAMDFPYSERAISILKEINPFVTDVGGRVYLTKDRTMDHHQFEKMYSGPLRAQKSVLDRIDPEKKIDSLFSQRLHIRE